MLKFMIIPLIIILLMGIFFYFKFIDISLFWGFNLSKKWILLITLIFILPAFYVFKIYFLVLLHLFMIGISVEIINIILKMFKNSSFSILWQNLSSTFILPIVLTIFTFIFGYFNAAKIIKTEYTVKTNKNIRAEGYKLILIADIHSGTRVSSSNIDKEIEKINNENADIIVLVGDIVDENTSTIEMNKIFEKLSKIKNKNGIYYTFGNHENSIYGVPVEYSREELKKSIEENDIKILSDKSITINEDLTIIGRNDYTSSHRARVTSEDLIKDLDKEKFLLLLDHQPLELEKNAKLEYDLQVSGHTHRGQIFPAEFIMKKFNLAELSYGMKKINNFTAIVTSGMGVWGYPIRTSGNSEYVLINISKNDKK